MHTDTIRTRPDGSIDTAYYCARGRQMRGDQAHRLAGQTVRGLSALRTVSIVLVAVVLAGSVLV